MKAMVLAAGFGSRLRPWTYSHPKALVPVGGVPMLERVIVNLREQGFDRIVVNVHHFAEQIVAFLQGRDLGVSIAISDESHRLLDTGGAILHARQLLMSDDYPVLVHNVDILSNADLAELMRVHERNSADSTLLVSDRESGRKLVFGSDMGLKGWHHLADDRYLPVGFQKSATDEELSFSGIHVVGKKLIESMEATVTDSKFPLIEFLLSAVRGCKVIGYLQKNLNLIDIGKPSSLSQAQQMFGPDVDI